MPQISDAEFKQGYKIIGADVVDGTGKVVRSDTPQPGNAPANAAQETPAGSLPAVGAAGGQGGSIFDFQTTVRQALNEAVGARKNQQMGAVAPFTAGLPNNALSEVISSIKQGANLDATGTYNSFLDAQAQERKIQEQSKARSFDIIKAMADDGSLAELPDGAIIALSQQADMDAAQLLAWRKGVKSKNDLEREKTIADIAATKALAYERMHSNKASGYNNNKSLTVSDLKKYNLPSTVSQGQFKYLMDNLQEATAGVKLTESNRYDIWGKTSDWINSQSADQGSPLYGYNSSDFDGVLWEKFHPDQLAGYNKYVRGQQTNAQVNSGSNLEKLQSLLKAVPAKK